MVDRFLVWLGAGMVSAGVAAAMVAGAGFAAADTPTGSDATGTTSAESTKPTGRQADSDKNDGAGVRPSGKLNEPKVEHDGSNKRGSSTNQPRREHESGTATGADDPDATDDAEAQSPRDATDETGGSVELPTAPKADGSGIAEQATETPDKTALGKTAGATHERAARPVVDAKAAEPAEPAATTAAESPPAGVEPAPAILESAEPDITDTVAKTATLASMPSTAEINDEARAPLRGPLIDLIGTVFFTLFSLATRVFEGPPMLPAGSPVTVRTSTLPIDCGPGYEVPANWYFPSDPDPTRLIYLQHGFLASAPFYSYTAAILAEQTHSIVVAPSLSSNFFACDSCWLGGAPMQRAVADLFVGDRTALTESASAALGEPVTLPQSVVLVGHSAGGGLAAQTAGYMVDNGTVDDLAGVLMLDGVSFDLNGLATALGKLPEDLPVLQIASPRYFWNLWGDTIATMVAARPDHFNGVELVCGLHIDAMQGGNPLVQFGAYLVAGFSQPQNIEAAEILAVDWINDMFAGKTIYEAPGSTIEIPTDAGDASAIALPAPLQPLSPLEQLVRAIVLLGLRLLMGYEPLVDTAMVPSQDPKTALIGEFSTPNAA